MSASSVGKVDTPEGVGRLENFGKRVLNESGPMRKQVLQQLEEALSTGSVGARIPLMQRAAESSLLGASDAYDQAQESLGARAATPFGQSALAGARTQGALGAGQVPANFILPFMQSGPGIVGGFQNLGIEGLTGGSELRLSQEQFNAEQTAAFMRDLKDSIKSLFTRRTAGPDGDYYGQAMENYDPGTYYGGGFEASTPGRSYGY